MIDKRALMRDYRVARMGLSRRIRLRIRSTQATSVASVDPLSDAAPTPASWGLGRFGLSRWGVNDTYHYITAQFHLIKSTQDYDDAGAIQQERGVVYFHSMYLPWVQEAFAMYIGGTGKEWNKISVPEWDDSRCALKVIVEAQQ